MVEYIQQFIGSAYQQLLTNEIFFGLMLAAVIASPLAFIFYRLPNMFVTYFKKRYVMSITINSFDPSYQYIKKLISKNNFGKNRQVYELISSFTVNTVRADIEASDGVPPPLDKFKNKSLKYQTFLAPYIGSYLFRFEGKWLHVSFNKQDVSKMKGSNNGQPPEDITLSYLGRNNHTIVDKLKMHVFESRSDEDREVVSVYTAHKSGDYWIHVQELSKRKINTVVLPNNVGEGLLEDMDDFINSREWYTKHNIPYHRGYLFHGSAGTGKSSFAQVMAARHSMNLYSLSLNSCENDGDLVTLIHDVPKHSVLLLEDVDALINKRPEKGKNSKDVGVTVASLLNVLDGAVARNGIILYINNQLYR